MIRAAAAHGNKKNLLGAVDIFSKSQWRRMVFFLSAWFPVYSRDGFWHHFFMKNMGVVIIRASAAHNACGAQQADDLSFLAYGFMVELIS